MIWQNTNDGSTVGTGKQFAVEQHEPGDPCNDTIKFYAPNPLHISVANGCNYGVLPWLLEAVQRPAHS